MIGDWADGLVETWALEFLGGFICSLGGVDSVVLFYRWRFVCFFWETLFGAVGFAGQFSMAAFSFVRFGSKIWPLALGIRFLGFKRVHGHLT